MGVKIDPFLELPGRVDLGREWEKHVQYYHRNTGDVTVVNPQRVYGISGVRYLIPASLRPKHWKFRVRVFDGVPVRVSRLGKVLRPRRKTTKNGVPFEQYSGRAGELIVEYPTKDGLVSTQPVMISDHRHGSYYRDLRVRPVPTPNNDDFIERVAKWMQNQKSTPDWGPGETQDDKDKDELDLGTFEDYEQYRKECPLSQGPRR